MDGTSGCELSYCYCSVPTCSRLALYPQISTDELKRDSAGDSSLASQVSLKVNDPSHQIDTVVENESHCRSPVHSNGHKNHNLQTQTYEIMKKNVGKSVQRNGRGRALAFASERLHDYKSISRYCQNQK